MIYFVLKNHEYLNDVQTGIQIFYPNRHYYKCDEVQSEGITVISTMTEGRCTAEIFENGVKSGEGYEDFDADDEKAEKRSVRNSIYRMLSVKMNFYPEWGTITGVRPAKLAGELMSAGLSEEETVRYFMEKHFTSEAKAQLAVKVSKAEESILARNTAEDISLYVGIPFCPTRCLCCSFTSYPLDRYSKLVDGYLDKLTEEIKYIAKLAEGRRFMSVYVGGGTPTSLNEAQLERLLKCITENIDLSNALEFTVEAGRPDTITEEKLAVMKKYGVERISINPQTMNQKTLDLIGRRHTVEDIKNVYAIARKIGFKDINMDLILGLPEETVADVEHTMKEMKAMAPDSVTVHTLAVKRASRLKEQFDSYTLTEAKIMEEMIEISSKYAHDMGLAPYYMYRQKNMVGNFENVGYCRKGCEGIYNIEIMEEKQTILAAGAGATSKVYNAEKNLLTRAFNVKSVEEYIARFDEMLERKAEAFAAEK